LDYLKVFKLMEDEEFESDSSLKKQKHELYQKSVQNPKREVEFYRKIYRMVFKTIPTNFREDFCGTGRLACEWIKSNVCNTAVGLDLDEETIHWGIENNVSNLASGSERISLLVQDILIPFDSQKIFDVICSMNYSHYLLNQRKDLVKYFSNVRANISKGLFVMDFFGGSHMFEEHRHNNQSDYYEFRNDKINIVNNVLLCTLNFKTKDNKLETLFTYPFRVYSLVELKEALEDSGFNFFKIFIKDVSDDEENIFHEYKEIDYNTEYYPELERFNGYLIAIVK
jgi:SAM-dependent methyltransferase